MSTTMKAAIQLGPNGVEILEVYKDTNFEELKNLFDVTQRLIWEHEIEILIVSTIDWKASSWMISMLVHDQVIKWTKANVHVHSDSVVSFGKMQDHSGANQKCIAQLDEFQKSNSYNELVGIDGEPIELKWIIFPGLTSLEILKKIQKTSKIRIF